MIDKIHGYIYLITNLVNGKQYVGQTVRTIEIRYKWHHDDSKRKNCKMVIDRAINKYGIENFEIKQIDVAYNQEELNLIEGVYMLQFNTLTPNGYNVKRVINGKGRHSEETKEKMRIKANKPERIKLNSERAKIIANTPERIMATSELGKKRRGISYKNSSSKYVGVCVQSKKYIARIHYLNKLINLGTYNSEIDAAKAYDIGAIKYFGNNAVLNFPELRQDYIDGKIHVKKNKCCRKPGKSGEKNISFNKSSNAWRFEWFSKELNRNTSKYLKTLEETINFKKEKILDKDYLEYKQKNKD